MPTVTEIDDGTLDNTYQLAISDMSNSIVSLFQAFSELFSAMDSLVAMDSTNAIDSTNAKDSTVVPLERKMNSIENECAADVGSSGVVVDVESKKLNASIKSENKKKRLKSVATKGKEKKVEKGVKEKQNVKFEDLDGKVGGLNLGDVVDEVQGSKSVVYGKLHNRLSPSSVVNGAMDSKLDTYFESKLDLC